MSLVIVTFLFIFLVTLAFKYIPKEMLTAFWKVVKMPLLVASVVTASFVLFNIYS